ncbi:hypothetical protein PPL_04873 [Heterostelium album PN500]|uniref:Uncharacterized protein n=1 Tax=Heterostelium pallidum (strain ATCC 26659 / Pp 5 / PN500) TaxID=670386 RepID=D3B8T0_HETP5|nr:hypothetical protein PPL_04873 [Heterostelium album PN500]EFA82448.1 hypothetical protein PPL_04873 [Heterostelium album PN500]|eukprot:XP_020434565.1 hypothetical protein PPL_04873 [Heterostelium album PN500]
MNQETDLKNFCVEHKDPKLHECTKYVYKERRVHPCPECNELLVVGKDDDVDTVIVRHLDRDCGKKSNKPKSYPCTLKGCKAKEFVAVICDQCKENYCFKHRFPTSHKCVPLPKPSYSPTSLFKYFVGSGSSSTATTTTTTTRNNTSSPKPVTSPTSTRPVNNVMAEQKRQQEELRAIRAKQQEQYRDTQAEINVLLTNGEVITGKFNYNDSFRQIQQFINQNRTDGKSPYAIISESNPTPFSSYDLDLTLQELKLAPSSTLVLVELEIGDNRIEDHNMNESRDNSKSNFSYFNPFSWFGN